MATLAVAALVGCAASAERSTSSEATTAPAPTFAGPTVTFAPSTEAPPTAPEGPSTSDPAAPAVTEPPPPGGSDVLAAIDALVVAPDATVPGYDRALFGGGWIDADDDGCDTRCEVLEAERIPIPGGLTGWLSLYDGYSTDDPGELDIDHMVPLAEAWRSGASAWDEARRLAYANDLDAPTSLIAVTAATNRSKGDKDPALWQPSNDASWCAYVQAWVATKARWELTADPAEITALRNMATARSC